MRGSELRLVARPVDDSVLPAANVAANDGRVLWQLAEAMGETIAELSIDSPWHVPLIGIRYQLVASLDEAGGPAAAALGAVVSATRPSGLGQAPDTV